jgi:hypothetical protein
LGLLRCEDDWNLLPTELPGADAEARERLLLHHGGSRTGKGIPGLQALPSGREPGLA